MGKTMETGWMFELVNRL